MQLRSRLSFLGAAALAALVPACIQETAPEPTTSVQVAIPLIGDQCGVRAARAEVSAADIETIYADLDASGDSILGAIGGVPAGSGRVVTVDALNLFGQPVYSGSATVDVVEGETVQARLVLRRNWENCPSTGAAGEIEVIGELDNGEPDDGVLTGRFSFSAAQLAANGVVYFHDGARIQRLDLASETFLAPLTGSLGTFAAIAVSPDGATVYASYEGGRIDAIDTATGQARLFGTAPATVIDMVVAGDHLFVVDASGAWVTHALYALATGERVAADDWRHSARDLVYSPATGKVFYLFDGVSPTDVGSVQIAAPGGPLLGNEVETPYHGDYSLPTPIRLTPDESSVVVGSGVHFHTADLTYATSFGLAFTDVVFHGGLAHLLTASGGQTVIRSLDSTFSIVASRTVAGTPLRGFLHGDQLVVLTQGASGFQVHFVEAGI